MTIFTPVDNSKPVPIFIEEIKKMPAPIEMKFTYKSNPEMDKLFDEMHRQHMETLLMKALVLLDVDFDYEVVIEQDYRGRQDYSRQAVNLKTKRALIVANHFGLISKEKLSELLGDANLPASENKDDSNG